jgi:hypothetical protein
VRIGFGGSWFCLRPLGRTLQAKTPTMKTSNEQCHCRLTSSHPTRQSPLIYK